MRSFSSQNLVGKNTISSIRESPKKPDLSQVNKRASSPLSIQTNSIRIKPLISKQSVLNAKEKQVERTPEATALVYEDQVLSYAELNARANRLAHRLIELGVMPDQCVAICVARSPALVVGLLAILKAGGAYVPLDPAYSSERLTHILTDAAPTILLADVAGRTALDEAALSSITVLDPNELSESASTNPKIAHLRSDHLAYVIYTSGSTGVPKGVMVEHSEVTRLFEATASWYHFDQHDTWCLFHSFAFDFSVWELWGALRYGGKLVIVPHQIARSPQEFYRLLCEQGVTVLNQTPSAFKSLIACQAQSALSDRLRYVIFGGEALEPASLQAWYATRSEHSPQLVNMYGITEITVHATYCPLQKQDSEQASSPIGRRIPDLKVYLLDAYSQPVPLGVAGELYIGGAGVARGYLNRPELTAERFLSDPFSEEANARMYKTGDLARYLADGSLEFLGRNDHQIKIRGFRVEPGEIEARLIDHPQVREAVVLALGEGSDKRLIAYVVAEADDQLASTLRAHLTTKLPDYMMPAAFVRLDALPLTLNGKLDRRALPAPNEEAFACQVYEAPQGEMEKTLAAIWSELLRVERISRHDNFFALGGHSLLAVRLMNRIASLGAGLPLAVLFASPNLASFAAAVSEHLSEANPSFPAIAPVSREEVLPLSFAQQRLWFLAQLDGVSDIYHVPLAIRLNGALDRASWQRALDTVFARHEALRSIFVVVEGQPQVQLLAHESGFPMRCHDLRQDQNTIEQLERLSIEEAYAPFDLAQGPLIRASLIQLADDEHVFLLTQHHIVSDGWSMGVLLHELNTLYAAYRTGNADPLPPLTIQYPDYAAWQRQWLSGERLQAQSDYWRTTLADAPVLLNLPTDRPRPAQQSFAGAQVPIRLDAQMTGALKQLSHKHGTTLFMTLLAAWGAVLSRLSGQDDMVIGTPSANRAHPEIESLIGFFVNTLALRLDLSGEPNTVELLERIRRTTLDAQAHQDLPFEQMVEIVQPPRRLDHTPLFQVLFAWQNNEMGGWHLPALKATSVISTYDVVKFDLELDLREVGEEIIGELRYTTALFDRQTIERQLGYLHAMLRAMVSDAQPSLAKVDLLAPAERKLLLETWNATQQDYPQHQCVHQLFEEQVEHTPEAIALVYEDQALSYAELNARANRLAHRLSELGVGPDKRVAICVARSPAMVVGLLAILKAGGAYVPLDPAYPSERLVQILADATPTILLADTTGRTALGEATLASITVLDPNELPDSLITNPHIPKLRSDHLAYVIYTSGSTGTPKGVMMEHRAIVNLTLSPLACFGANSSSRILQVASLNFDVSIWEIFIALGYGASLYLLSEVVRRDRNELWNYLERHAITHAILPPALLQNGENLPNLGRPLTFILTGEASSAALLQNLSHHGVVFNAYGPTETHAVTVWAAEAHHLNHGVVSIGRPISNTQLYVLDAHGQPMPLGAVGELYIGGAGVARGYLNRSELTTERFLLDPFSNQTNARMYKTGDLARYLPDGNLEFLGRNDHQIKIRWFRIELSEIEARLLEHPQVREAAVLALGEGSDKRLVAYVVAEAGEQLASVLRTHLAARLPEYMIPAAFVRLDAWPLTPNGKLNWQALPAPSESAFARQAYEAPQGEIEIALAAIWAELLKVERVSRHDNFFALGGHSLLAVRLMNRITSLGVELPLAVLFASPSLSDFAAAVSERLIQANSSFSTIVPVSRDGALPLSFAQQRLWFLAQFAQGSNNYHIPLAIRLRGALDTVFARHEALRSIFVVVEGQPQVQLLAHESGFPMRCHDLRQDPNAIEQLERLSIEEAYAPFDLAQGPLIRASLIQLADDEHVFLLTQHHIVSDGWSMGVLLHELNALYAAYRTGNANPLPPLTIQYPDYAAWQRQWLSGERLQAQSDYWRTTLADAPVLLNLPTDQPRPAQQSFAGAQVPIRLDAQMTRSLKQLSQKYGVTVFMTLLAAWGAVLSRLSGQDDMVIGTPSANRTHREIESLIGFFVNTLALRLDLSGEPNTVELLERIRRSTLAAQAHQDLPFEQVVEIVQPPRRLDHTPLFQVMFAWQSNEEGEWHLPNLEVTPVALNYDMVKFDLELGLREVGEEIIGELSYATALFDRQTIERQVGYLYAMLKAMVSNVQSSLAKVDILAPAERKLLLETWNATQQDYPKHQCVHQLFEKQVERTPEATALVYEDQVLSYAELNARANRLAHRLIELGVGPDQCVAICVARSPALVVGLLAILKAGGAYVPLDPAYSSERLTHILTDVAPTILLADGAGRTALDEAALSSITVLDPNELPESAITNPHVPGLNSSHLAYVIYTSGSTGVPKGVMVEHSEVTRLFEATASWYHFDQHDTWCLFHSFAFDVSVWELWGALRYGGKLVIVPHQIARSPQELYRLLCEQGVTVLNQTPSAFKPLIACQAQSALKDRLRYVILAGETLEPASLQPWYATRSEHSPQLVNMYGPTEITVYATYRPLQKQDSEQAGSPIGRRIPDLKVYLLDAYSQPVPLGAVGELYIGGAGVARGYLNRPELTAERFLPDPFNDEANARMYKTGDLARYLPDGNLEFLGRNDDQVKIRGFRIEPGEIEARLLEHPQVREVAVFALGEGSDKRLVTYVVAEADEQLASTLRAHLTAKLPDYMMPAAFVRLDALPLTPNGKLDRRALPAPDDEAFARQVYEAPQGEIETTLANIWAELLKVERISRHDSFFALGGHSLLAIRMASRIRNTLGNEISVRTLFDAPTIAGLAQRLLKSDGVQANSYDVLLPIRSEGSRPPLFCFHPGGGLSWCYTRLSQHLDKDQPIYGLQARGFNDISQPAETIHAMVSDYIKQIRRIQPNGPYYLLGWSFGGSIAHSIATQLEQQGERVAFLALLDTHLTPPKLDQADQVDAEILRSDFAALYGEENIPNREDDLWEKMANVFKNNARLFESFSPLLYSGDLLFFRATIPQKESIPVTSPDLWKPYVLGDIEVCNIHCNHEDMAEPTPMAEIGLILAKKLNKLQKQQPSQSEVAI